MTTRVQTLRSSVSGNVPAAGTRNPGELWTNFADFQLGMIDATRTAQKLVAVRYFQATASYVLNDVVAQAGKLYVANGPISPGAFNATQWTALANATDLAGYVPLAGGVMTGLLSLSGPPTAAANAATKAYVDGFTPLAGGVMTGLLTLSGPPTAANNAATKAYVDTAVGTIGYGDNRIVNGDMRIDQRNNGASGQANGYTVDRWSYFGTQAAKINWQRSASPIAFPYCLGFSSNGYTPLATDAFFIDQPIEADMISDFLWGGSSAQSVTLSFWASSSLSGTMSGAISNYGTSGTSTRAYPFTFTLPATPTWTKYVITVPGDTTGTWLISGNGVGLYLRFDLGSGANYRGPAGAWGGGNFVGANGAINIVATNGAVFSFTGVKLEVGSVATPYNRYSLAKCLADCQRYYQIIYCSMNTYQAAGTVFGYTSPLGISMRAAPTLVNSSPTYTNASGFSSSASGNINSVATWASATALGNCAYNGVVSASAEL